MFSTICLLSAIGVYADSDSILRVQASSVSTVVPLPEADQQYSTSTPVNAIIVKKNGEMSQAQYPYDPDQGGVVINNYDDVNGPGSSLFFPAFGVGMLWANGYWADQSGYYWNGNRYVSVNNDHWDDHWNNYWHNDWNNKWNNYKRQHPEARNIQGQRNGSFEHRQGMDRRSNPPRGGRGFHGGGRGGGGRR